MAVNLILSFKQRMALLRRLSEEVLQMLLNLPSLRSARLMRALNMGIKRYYLEDLLIL
jgi:hypothetical protein